MLLENYSQFGFTEKVSGALRNILDYMEIRASHSNEPFTESLLMGIGGGLGAEYATWAFKGIDPSRSRKSRLYLRFHHSKNYIKPKEESALQKIVTRIGASLTINETASENKATEFLHESLQTGKPVITQLSVWHGIYSRKEVNQQYHQNPHFFPPLLYDEYVLFLPYYNLPYPWISSHLAIIYGIDQEANQVILTDFSNKPHTISTEQLIRSRGIMKGWKNAAYTIDFPQTKLNLLKAVKRGIHDCTESLLYQKSVVSGAHLRVEAWQAMAKNASDFKGKRGWITIFNEPSQLFDTLTRLHAQIAFHNSDGGALRSSFADFLENASDILKNPALKEIAKQFSEIGIMWDELATAALPDYVPELRDTRLTALKWHNLFKVQGSSGKPQLEIIAKKIKSLRYQFCNDCPLTENELLILFEDLGSRFLEIYKTEKQALHFLKKTLH
ncbi:MAG: BtrH N-terminal domain-containing protein [Candidatus Thorarchaeota archaeon]